MATAEQIWLAKDNGKGNGNGQGGGHKKLLKNGNGNSDHGKRGNGNGKPAHAGGKAKKDRKDVGRASNGHGNGASARRALKATERDEAVSRLVSTRAPEGRDMLRILGASALALATPQLVVSDIPEDDLIRYSNCPPGLAKKDPPCVPPGLARTGISYDEWASYDQDEYDAIWLNRREEWLRSRGDVDPDPERLLLQSDQIARLFDLDPAPKGHRYALIDGLPVLLDDKDYSSLLLVNQMAQVPDVKRNVPIAPTAALTQDELIDAYRLPQLGADENYAVVNGQLVRLNDSNYEMLQMIRIARATF